MNDRHPSGTATTPAPASDDASVPYAPYGAQGAAHGGFTTFGGHDPHTGTTTAFAADPLFGAPAADGAHTTGSWDTGAWATDGHGTTAHGTWATYPAQHPAVHDTGTYDTGAWATGFQQPVTSAGTTGQWDTTAWPQPGAADAAGRTQQWNWDTQTFDTSAFSAGTFDTGSFSTTAFDTGAFVTTAWDPAVHDTGAWDATQWNTGAQEGSSSTATGQFPGLAPQDASEAWQETHGTGRTGALGESEGGDDTDGTGLAHPADDDPAADDTPAAGALEQQGTAAPGVPSPRAASRSAGRSRRRAPARRSALLTVAVPSACVMGVAGIAAGSVGVFGDDGSDATASAANVHPVQPAAANNQLDSQLQSLSAGADDFADRASRTQERIDLKAQKEAEQRKAAEEAARKERLRPKFLLPVTQKGLSAYFGQAGVNWMSVHTGIDFPVAYGTTVMAATDGTVRTQWNSAYGNMMIVTAKDGTETWYCHLSRYRVPSGTTVKAGQPIAYSGNSGNSTGPHLHFEVRPGGGAPIDPLPWLRSHGLDPT
ncbi:M23 family metallopeptidase [Streptomyces thermodiastaticus]|uniref:M23 family metallopeptidase n=1 Tax=Streptomyces thermodiastaticus TaxID=44061 RepID=UPI0016785BD5|nr:M23 family metallopeptidase [Streptomyces thermodiastaticus]MCE7550154.1 M23 family metallopeptidase [Streptomyces thermodiastaticus]GHF67801.1 peptidase [Streptomyces thermodiastaticus]